MQTAILMNLKTVMPSERRHTYTLYVVLFYLYDISRRGKSTEIEIRCIVETREQE